MSVYISQICDMCTDQRAVEIGPHPDNIECAIRRDGWEKINNVFPQTYLKSDMGGFAGTQDNDPVVCPKCVEELRHFIKFFALNKQNEREVELEANANNPTIKSRFYTGTTSDPQGTLKIHKDGSIIGQFKSDWDGFDDIAQRMRTGHVDGFLICFKLSPAEPI